MKNRNDFEFNYTAPTSSERKEIERIRDSYIQKENSLSKIDYLRKLDNKVRNIPTIYALVFGVIGILIFGLGFAMVLEWKIIVWGVVVSVIGLIPMIISYPIYLKISKNLKNKYSDEIIKLSNEILDENK